MDAQLTSNELKKWLEHTGTSREALADLMGVSKSTVDGWCSNKPVGKRSRYRLRLLMMEHGLGLTREPSSPEEQQAIQAGPSLFTGEQWAAICRAAKLRRMTPSSFLKWAVFVACDKIYNELKEG